MSPVFAAEAFEAAEGGLSYTINDGWQTSTFNALAVGQSSARPTIAVGATAQAAPTVTRLNSAVFLVQSEGQRLLAGNVAARRLIGTLVRVVIPDIEIEGALTVYGELTLGGSADIDGNDHIPGGWGGSCGGAGSPVAGVRINEDDIHTNGANCGGDPPNCVEGYPAVNVDSTVTPSTGSPSSVTAPLISSNDSSTGCWSPLEAPVSLASSSRAASHAARSS